MADPVKKPLIWSKSYPKYAEKHEMYRVFQELLKELIVLKPPDPLVYIRDELPTISKQLHVPRVFLVGPNISTQGIGRHMAQSVNCRYLTLADIVETAPTTIRGVLAVYVQGEQDEESFDDTLRKLLIATIMQRVRRPDCQKNGWIIYGFPQNKNQAVCAQQSGLLPRQVFVLMPDPSAPIQLKKTSMNVPMQDSSSSDSKAHTQTPTTNTTSYPTPSSQVTSHSQVTWKSGDKVDGGGGGGQGLYPTGATVGGVPPKAPSQPGGTTTGLSTTVGGGVPGATSTGVGGGAASIPFGVASGGAPSQSTSGKPIFASLTTKDTIIEEIDGTLTRITSHVSLPENNDIEKIKEIVDAYDYEICKVIAYEKWYPVKKTDIEAELLATLVSVKPCGCPWIPRILVLGPPSSGKSTVAEALAEKYGVINVDFLDCVRGAARLDDDLGKACRKYMGDLNPLTDVNTKHLLQKRLLREDCEKKGYILHGFPDTYRQLALLENLDVAPNRVFYLACLEEQCFARFTQKRQEVLERKMEGAEDKVFLVHMIDENNFEEFPYGKSVFRKRWDTFLDAFEPISSHYSKNMIYVDASKRIQTVIQFVEEAVLRPPVIRFSEDTEGQ